MFGEPQLRKARVYVEEVARALRLSLLLAQQATLVQDCRRRCSRAALSTRRWA